VAVAVLLGEGERLGEGVRVLVGLVILVRVSVENTILVKSGIGSAPNGEGSFWIAMTRKTRMAIINKIAPVIPMRDGRLRVAMLGMEGRASSEPFRLIMRTDFGGLTAM